MLHPHHCVAPPPPLIPLLQVEALGTSNVAVFYASAYGNTAALAQAISHGLTKAGMAVNTVNLELASVDEVQQTIKSTNGFVIGSPTLGGHMPTQVQVRGWRWGALLGTVTAGTKHLDTVQRALVRSRGHVLSSCSCNGVYRRSCTVCPLACLVHFASPSLYGMVPAPPSLPSRTDCAGQHSAGGERAGAALRRVWQLWVVRGGGG